MSFRSKFFIGFILVVLSLGVPFLFQVLTLVSFSELVLNQKEKGQKVYPLPKIYQFRGEGIVFTLGVQEGHLLHTACGNKYIVENFHFKGPEFVLFFREGKVKASDLVVEEIKQKEDEIVVEMGLEKPRLEVRLTYKLGPEGFYVRKKFLVRTLEKGGLFLSKVRLIDYSFSKDGRDFKEPGQPVYKGEYFFGVEYPLARNYLDGNRVIGEYEVGRRISSDWFETYSAVVGVSERGKVQEGFFAYLDGVRAIPNKPFLLYNSWYDFRHYSSQDIVSSIEKIKENLTDNYGIKLDAIVLDDGWDKFNKLWEFHPERFPEGLEPVSRASSLVGAKPGLWVSPRGGYVPDILKRLFGNIGEGYEKNLFGYCIAGEDYYLLFKKKTLDAIDLGVVYFKVDNLGKRCQSFWHKHRVGPYSDEAIQDAILDVIKSAREKNPQVFYNVTVGAVLSPFWLLWAQCVWMGGMDYGFSGEGSKREQSITYRDANLYKNFRIKEIQFPLNSLMTHGIIKARYNFSKPEPSSEFEHDVVMYFGRGVSMWELYISPDLLTEKEWETLAKWINWAKENWEILRFTRMILGDPKKGEIYGYLHQKNERIILLIRNPSGKNQSLKLKPEMFGLSEFQSIQVIYPEDKTVNYSKTSLEEIMKPFEVLLFRL